MSIQDEINRLDAGISDAKSAIAEKGVEVPEGTRADGLGALIRSIASGSPVEIREFWRQESGNNYIAFYAVSLGSIVCYYCVISALDGLSGTTTTDDGYLTDLREYGEQFVPDVTLDGSPATMDNFNATFLARTGLNHDIYIRLSFLYVPDLGMNGTDIEIKVPSSDLSFIATPGVVFLGMCKSQEAQPSTLAARASAPTPDVDPAQIYDALYPVGSIKMWYDNADHSTFLGFKWERCLAGRAPVGINPSEAEFASIGQTGGEKTHALTTAEIPPYSSHGFSAVESSRNPRIESFNGNGQPHNNLQPYEVIAPWRRIS